MEAEEEGGVRGSSYGPGLVQGMGTQAGFWEWSS